MGGGLRLLLHVTSLTLCPLSAFVSVCVCVCAVSLCAVSIRSVWDSSQQPALSVVVVLVGDYSHTSLTGHVLLLYWLRRSSHHAVLKELPGSLFSSECADTLGWSVFVLAPLLVATLTLKHCFRALNLPSWAEAAYPARQIQITCDRYTETTMLHVTVLLSN